jgi:hypothetical protein
MPAVRTDKMTVKEEKDKEKKEKTTRQSFSCAECRRYVMLFLRRVARGGRFAAHVCMRLYMARAQADI